MPQFKIANVLLDSTPQFVAAPTLLCRSSVPFVRDEESGVWTLGGPGTHDFTTFFNGLSVEKWRRYTVAKAFHLHLELSGASATVTQTRADSFTWYSDPVKGTTVEVPAGEDWHEIDLDLVVTDADVVVGFTIETQGPVGIRNGFYSTDVEESEIRPVELALSTTTFKKEEFIERNVALVKERILASSEPLASHFQMYVVDNGRTLDPAALDGPGVTVYPNDNVGGSGGFARGMIEAMERTPKATHILLMDDDVEIAPESIIRTFNLLAIVNDEYAGAFVSGMMMSLDEPALRWEDLGYVTAQGEYAPLKWPANMGLLHDAVLNESYEIPVGQPGYEDTARHYASWWYCVIPMETVNRAGLPLPIFVRGDDVEYSLRVRPKFITMNGIGVWHMPFPMRYSAAVERYQVIRNSFIAQATTGIAGEADFTARLRRVVQLELKKFNYDNAELALGGFEDFLKGPGFISRRVAESSFMDANKRAEKLIPVEQMRVEADREGIDLENGLSSLERGWDFHRSLIERAEDLATFNGQRFDPGYVKKGRVAVIDAAGWLYPAGQIRRADTIVAIDLPNHKGVIRHIDRERFTHVWTRYKRDMKFYKANRERLNREYAAARSTLTSVMYWKKYLGLDKSATD